MADDPRRKAQRYDIRIGAELAVGGKHLTGTTRNLSLGGLCVEIDRPVPEGTLLQLTLFVVEDDVEAASGRGLTLSGTVQWQAEGDRGYALGIKFGVLTPAQTNSLKQALARVGET
jgi:hypothetical protein